MITCETFFMTLMLSADVAVSLSGKTSLLININYEERWGGRGGSIDDHETTGVAEVTPNWIVQFPRRKSLRVPQLQLQLYAPPQSECLLLERVEAARYRQIGKNRESHRYYSCPRSVIWLLLNDSAIDR